MLRIYIGKFEKILKNFRNCRKFWRHCKLFLRDFDRYEILDKKYFQILKKMLEFQKTLKNVENVRRIFKQVCTKF